jgi:GH15 family glucan-1,4-alpha-glucosidase
VVSPESKALTRLYAHPYKFEKPDPKNALSEGIETTSFIKQMAWSVPNTAAASHPVDTRDKTSGATLDYLGDSQIVTAETKGLRQFFYMPFGIDRNVLITTGLSGLGAVAASLHIEWEHPVSYFENRVLSGVRVRVFKFEGVQETVVMIPIGDHTAPDDMSGNEFELEQKQNIDLTASNSWAVLSLEDGATMADIETAVSQLLSWAKDLTPSGLAEREVKQFDKWRTPPTVHFNSDEERKLWRRSEMVLRIAQSREPDRSDRHNHGLIIASLPDGAWFVPWVRDMACATVALTRMGHKQEARWALESYFNARPVSLMQAQVKNVPYQVSVVRYFGDGSEEPFFTGEGATNIEFDDWGLVLWALGEYNDKFHDDSFLSASTYRGTVFDCAKEFIVKPLLANMEPYKNGLIVDADTSIWEERQKDKKHFAFSSGMAIVGLSAFDKIAVQKKDVALHRLLQQKLALLKKGFQSAFVRGGRLHGTLEAGIKNDIDGALLALINLGVEKDTGAIERTVAAMSKLKMPSGGYRRVHSTFTDPAIFEYWYERQEFLFVNFSLAEIYLRLHQPAKAAQLLQTMVHKSAQDRYFIPEMYVSFKNYRFTGDIGEPTGAVPMVGYGAGEYIAHLVEREKLLHSH